MALPAGWTSSTVRKWELRRGDPTTIIKFNIDTIAGIGSVSEVRDWLLGQGYRIDKEWWEQNDFYVIRIWGTISPMWWEQHWGPSDVTTVTPPPGKVLGTPPNKVGRPPLQPVPQPGNSPQGTCKPSSNRRWKPSKQPVQEGPELPAPIKKGQLPADIYWVVWNFMFNNLANIQSYIDFFFPEDPLAAERERMAKRAAYQADIDDFWEMTQQAYAIWRAANPFMAYIDFAVNFVLTPRGPNRQYIDDPNPAWTLS